MARMYEIGDRISFSKSSSASEICTVRYVGEVDGFKGQWLGVEWDDDSRGKHDGCPRIGVHHRIGLSHSSTAGSFVRPSRPADQEQSLIEAIYNKYALGITNSSSSGSIYKEVIISGKIVQEIGFDKVRETQARLHDLKIVIIDGMRISMAQREDESIKDFCPNIVELDLSRNLFRRFKDIHFIYSKLDKIQRLSLNGNRFSDLESLRAETDFPKKDCFTGITKLELDEVLLPWDSLVILRSYFPFLTNLTASSNQIRSLTCPLMDGLVSLTLEYNEIESLGDLLPLSDLKFLKTLLLKGNKISKISNLSAEIASCPKFGVKLEYVDLSYNRINSWSFVDNISAVFPGLTSLRISNNPLYPNQFLDTKISGYDENFLITIGRLKNLKTLNFSNVTAAERCNAEIYYLAKIGQELSEIPEDQIDSVKSRHKRFHELCEKWGAPSLNRNTVDTCNQNTIESRLISFKFEYAYAHKETREEKIVCRQIPKSIDVYRVKALVGHLFGISMLDLRLIWATGEWDPVAGYEDDELETIDYDNPIKNLDHLSKDKTSRTEKRGRGWMKREVEIEDSTRQIGSYIEGIDATVRVERVAPKP